MDPNELLDKIREIVATIQDPDNDEDEMAAEYGAELAELIDKLDKSIHDDRVVPDSWFPPGWAG